MEMDAFLLIEIMALSTGVFLGIHFLTSSHQFKPKQFLAWFMLISFLPDLVAILVESQQMDGDFIWLLPNTNLIYIPFLYFYVKAITGSFTKKHLLFLLPAVLLYPFQVLGIIHYWDVFLFVEALFSYAFNILMLMLILKALQKHQKNLFNYFSSLEDKSLNWLRILTIVMIGFNLLWAIEDLIYLFTDYDLLLPLVSGLATFVTVYWIGFKSLRQPDFFIPSQKEVETKSDQNLSEPEIEIFENLEALMLNAHLYKKQDISLRSLSEDLKVSDKVLSKIINLKTQNNFYYYINSYRVKAFKEALEKQNHQDLTLFGLAQEFGFKSKSTFYAVFKKMENLTPSEFLKQLQTE
jgi:AraC-like DNA-binding protein